MSITLTIKKSLAIKKIKIPTIQQKIIERLSKIDSDVKIDIQSKYTTSSKLSYALIGDKKKIGKATTAIVRLLGGAYAVEHLRNLKNVDILNLPNDFTY